MGHKKKILFLCTGNSCLSQMAEGWTRHLRGDEYEAFSAGTEIHGLNPSAVKVMAEAGVDISRQRSKTVDELQTEEFDTVVTVCGHAHESCPVFPGRVVHAGFDDPPKMAMELANKGASLKEKLECYRRVRDEIKRFVASLPESLDRAGGSYFEQS